LLTQIVTIQAGYFLPISAGWKPCLSTKKPLGLSSQSALADFHELRRGFIPPNIISKQSDYMVTPYWELLFFYLYSRL